jgi:hypothetical protein
MASGYFRGESRVEDGVICRLVAGLPRFVISYSLMCLDRRFRFDFSSSVASNISF